jgi:hypothetical protein
MEGVEDVVGLFSDLIEKTSKTKSPAEAGLLCFIK